MLVRVALIAVAGAIVLPAGAQAKGKVFFEDTIPAYEPLPRGRYTWRVVWSGRRRRTSS